MPEVLAWFTIHHHLAFPVRVEIQEHRMGGRGVGADPAARREKGDAGSCRERAWRRPAQGGQLGGAGLARTQEWGKVSGVVLQLLAVDETELVTLIDECGAVISGSAD